MSSACTPILVGVAFLHVVNVTFIYLSCLITVITFIVVVWS